MSIQETRRRNPQRSPQDASAHNGAAGASRGRRIVVGGRWAAATVAAAMALAATGAGLPSPVAHGAACMAPAFLFANALWQHMPLGRACALALAIAVALGAAGMLAAQAALGQEPPLQGGVAACVGAGIGTLAARLLLPAIDRFVSPFLP